MLTSFSCRIALTWCCVLLIAGAAARVQGQQSLPPPSDVEQRILSALDAQTDLDFRDTPLAEAVHSLKGRLGIPIRLDIKALAGEGVAPDVRVTTNVRGVTLASALDLLLSQLDLTYVLHDELLLITSETAAEDLITTKVYPVGDLLNSHEAASRSHLRNDYQSLIELITGSFVPSGWSESASGYSIQEFRSAKALVISTSFHVHRDIEKLLASVRAAKQEQTAANPQPKDEEEAVPDDETFYLKVYRLPFQWSNYSLTMGGMGGGFGPATMQPAAEKSTETPACNSSPAEDLAKAIPAVIEPDSWSPEGGSIHAFDYMLFVHQKRTVHRQIEGLLRKLENRNR